MKVLAFRKKGQLQKERERISRLKYKCFPRIKFFKGKK
jgi:hypothetical protein